MNPLKVFIVDDSDHVTEVLSELIEEPGRVAVCGTADSAPGAIEAIARMAPDIVIVDLQLRGGSGLDVLDAVRSAVAVQGRAPPLVVLFTNHVAPELKRAALARGADHFLDKTSDHERLIELIGECADRRAG